MEQYDITLVFFNARLHNSFLSIIKHLGKKYKICLWVAPYFKAERTKKTNTLFLDVCRELGATIVKKQKIKTKLLFITHITALNKEYLETEILKFIACEQKLSMQAFGIIEPRSHKALFEAGFRKHIVFDKGLYEHLIKTQGRDQLEKIDLLEMGNIISSYPVFEEFSCDYMIAIPTGLSFETERSVYTFLRNLVNFINKIGADDSIVIKMHTAKDNEAPFRTGRFFKFFSRKSMLWGAAGNALMFLNYLSGELLLQNKHTRDALAGVLYRQVLKRCLPLSRFHKCWNFGVELFMPGIKKGIITGRSTVTWFALTQKIPVFNCDPESQYYNSQYLNDHFACYGVPFCGGNLNFDRHLWEKVTASNGKFDFMEFIQSEVSEVNACT